VRERRENIIPLCVCCVVFAIPSRKADRSKLLPEEREEKGAV
jgi:hypothetical protein